MAHPNHLQTDDRSKATLRARHARQMAIVMLAASTLSAVMFAYWGFQTGAGQLFGQAGVMVLFSALIVVSLRLINRNRVSLGVRLFILGLLGAIVANGLFAAGLGPVLGLSALFLTSMITSQTLSRKETGPMIAAAFVAGAAALLVDIYGSPNRLSLPALQTFIPAIIGLVAVLYAFFIIRQFADFSLRAKLITAFLITGFLSMGLVTFFADYSISAALTNSVGTTINNLAQSQARAIGDLLAQQVSTLQSLGLNGALQNQVETTNALYDGSPAEIRAAIAERDRQWATAPDADSLVQSRLQNPAASELLEFKHTFPHYVELVVTDRYGGLVAATTGDVPFDYTAEGWWQAAYDGGQGAVFIGQPRQFEAAGDVPVVIVAVPVYAHNSKTVAGVLRAAYRLDPLANLIEAARFGKTGHIEIYLPNGLELDAAHGELEIEAAEFDLAVFAQNRPPGELAPYVAAPYNDRPSLIDQAPVTSVTGEPAVDALNWVVITHQDRSEALVPVAAQRRAGLLLILAIIGVMAVVAVGVGQLLANPLIRLTDVAEKISGGNLRAQADVTTADETGKLATAFNAMTRRLRQTIDTLEETVAGRTQQLETVVDIGRQLTGILDLNELLQQLVTQIKETFNYYHIHIYLLDRQSETLTVAEGYGEAGAAMKRRGHSISLAAPRSLVARAAREGRIITVEDVRQDPFWLPNPLLPDTRSEMAVPVMLGPEVVGVLDVQSAELAGLTQQDETALQALALQIATAVHNARLFTRTQNALEEAERLRQLYTGQAWEQFGGALPTTDYEFRQPALPPLQAVPTPEAEAARKQAQTVDLRLPASGANGDTAAGDPDSQQTASPDTPHSALATPLKLGNQVIGVLGIHHADPDRRWTEDEIALLETVSEQMSLALDNARLFEETGRRAAREKVIADLTSRVWASGELEDVMQTAVSQLGTILDASKVVIRLGTEDQLQAGES